MMDIVVVAYPKTIPLLKVFCESFRLHYKGSGYLIIFSDSSCMKQIKDLDLPNRVKIISKEEILSDHLQYSGYLTQQYFKFFSHQVIENPSYLVADDDFLFIRPTNEAHFFHEGKPVWFYQNWQYAGKAIGWKEPTLRFFEMEGFKGSESIEQPYLFLTSNPTYIYSRNVVDALWNRINPRSILKQEKFAEGQTYGAFAYSQFRDHYHWLNNYWWDEVLGGRVNQIPPDYLTLDPTIRFEDFAHFNFLSFWSHWSRAEEKMKEFLEASR